MKKSFSILLLIMSFYLSGCISKKEEQITEEIQTQFKANNYKIGHSESIYSSKGVLHTVELDFSGADDSKVNDYVVSNAAYYFFKNVSQKDVKYDQIKIVIGDDKSKFERSYACSDIQILDSILQGPMNKFWNWYKIDSVKYLIESNMLSDSDLGTIINVMHQIDSVYGGIKGVEFKGFEFKHLEGTEEPVAVLWLDIKNGEAYTTYKFFVLMANRKIFYIQINDKKAG